MQQRVWLTMGRRWLAVMTAALVLLGATGATATAAVTRPTPGTDLPPAQTLSTPPPFSDVPADHPFALEIGWAATNDVAGGYVDGTFRPTVPVTRQAFAAFLARYWVSPDVPTSCSEPPFPDVPTDSPFCPQITWLKTRGLAAGYPDGTFRPGTTITRQALAAFLYRFRGSSHGPDPACDAAPAVDVALAHPFCGEIAWFADVGLTTATPTTAFNPAATTTRQTAAAFLYRLDPGCQPAAEPTGGCPRPAVPGDVDGDRKADDAWMDDAGSRWAIVGQDARPGPDSACYTAFIDVNCAGDRPTPGDWNGDGRWDLAIFDESRNLWSTVAGDIDLPPPPCPMLTDDDLPNPAVVTVLPMPGDWDGDRTTDPGWYCPTTGTWHLEDDTRIELGRPAPHTPTWIDSSAYSAGLWSDLPIQAFDGNGDGTDEPAVYRPTDGSVITTAGTVITGLPLGFPLAGERDGTPGDDITVHQQAPRGALGPPPGAVHRFRSNDGIGVDVAVDPDHAFLSPALLDMDGDGTDEIVGIHAAMAGRSPGTVVWWVEGIVDVEFPDPGFPDPRLVVKPMSAHSAMPHLVMQVDLIMSSCRATTTSCPPTLAP